MIQSTLARRRAHVASLVLALGGFALATMTAANAAPNVSRPKQLVVNIYEVVANAGSQGSLIVTGGIADDGIDHIGARGHGSANELVLSHGTFQATNPFLSSHYTRASSKEDTHSCTLTVEATSREVLSVGTGAYRGLTGTLNVSMTRVSLLRRNSAGGCGGSIRSVEWLQGSGIVS